MRTLNWVEDQGVLRFVMCEQHWRHVQGIWVGFRFHQGTTDEEANRVKLELQEFLRGRHLVAEGGELHGWDWYVFVSPDDPVLPLSDEDTGDLDEWLVERRGVIGPFFMGPGDLAARVRPDLMRARQKLQQELLGRGKC